MLFVIMVNLFLVIFLLYYIWFGKGVTLRYILYSKLRPRSKWKLTVNLKYSPQLTVKPLYLFDVINYTVKGQANFKQKTHNRKINAMLW